MLSNPSDFSETVGKARSALRLYGKRREIDAVALASAYGVLARFRRVSDPLSYAADFRAEDAAQRLCQAFQRPPHDMQIVLLGVRRVLDDILSGNPDVDVRPADRFFSNVAALVPA